MSKRDSPRPFLKWAGGKTQILNELAERLPRSFETYHEPFLGGGAFFFSLHRNGLLKDAHLSDLNAELIDAYTAIRDQVKEVISLLAEFPHSEKFFYDLRSKDPWEMTLSERAARMIYLNKTCFNGLYRVNRRGQFNVPFGRYKAPKYCDPVNLQAVSTSLQDVEISCSSFETVSNRAQAGDLVYFDPPYDPVSATASFTAYQRTGFSREAQAELRDVCVALTECQVQIMLSNSSTEYIQGLYASTDFTIIEVQANRAISSNPKTRGKLAELLILGYPVG